MDRLDSLCIYAVLMARAAKEKAVEFWEKQDGVSNVVATIIILLIVVLLIGVFWDRLQEWVGGLMDDIFTDHGFNDTSGLG